MACLVAGDMEARIAPVLQSLHWEYRGIDGPSAWGKDYLTCDEGMQQSPVNIESQVIAGSVRTRERTHYYSCGFMCALFFGKTNRVAVPDAV